MKSVYIGLLLGAGVLASVAQATTILPLAIPASQQGTGYYYLWTQPESGLYYGQTICSGSGASASGTGCTLSATNGGGSAAGQVLAYNDQFGEHALVHVSSFGYAQSEGEAIAAYVETIGNPTAQTEEFAIGFHVDATVLGDPDGRANLLVDFNNSSGLCPTLDEYSPCRVTQQWVYSEGNNSTTVNQDFLTNTITLAPGTSYTFTLGMDAVAVSYDNGLAYTDASDTLAITSFSTFDQNGNPITFAASGLTSADGANYSGIDPLATPEPSTLLLFVAGLVAVGALRHTSAMMKSPCGDRSVNSYFST